MQAMVTRRKSSGAWMACAFMLVLAGLFPPSFGSARITEFATHGTPSEQKR